MSRVETIGSAVTKAHLTKISVDPDLEGFIVVAFWKDGSVSTGWSDMKNTDLSFGSLVLTTNVARDLFDE